MGRVRSKGKKNQDDPASDEEKIPTQKRRGRPQKTIKDEMEDVAAEKVLEDEEDSEGTANGASKNKDTKSHSIAKQNGRKRKNNGGDAKDEVEYSKEENGSNIAKNKGDENNLEKKSNGLRQTRHRRKGKPCRAPEAVVECT